jgi:hypothetical protein
MAVTPEELGQFLRASPPREVPASIRRRKLRGLAGCFPYLFAAMFIGVGAPLSAAFFPWRLIDELRLDLGTPATSPGVVTASEETSMSVNEQTVLRVRFRYAPRGGGQMEGLSYQTGRGERVGAEVVIEHLEGRPSACRVRGGRLNAFGYFAILVGVFPLIGLAATALALRSRRRILRILRWGTFVNGRVTDVKATNVTVNNERQHRVTVEFDTPAGPETIVHKAYGADVVLAQRHATDGVPIGLLYDPHQPRRVLLAESLLGG